MLLREAEEKDIPELADLKGELGYPTETKAMEERFAKIAVHPHNCSRKLLRWLLKKRFVIKRSASSCSNRLKGGQAEMAFESWL
nr:hypothetical protein [Fictibacillus sp. FJAT-27399]